MKKIKKKIPDHDKHIATPELNQLTKENFDERLTQANLASKNDITGLVKKADFDGKLRKINNNVTSNKTRHAEAEKKLK